MIFICRLYCCRILVKLRLEILPRCKKIFTFPEKIEPVCRSCLAPVRKYLNLLKRLPNQRFPMSKSITLPFNQRSDGHAEHRST